MGRSGLGGAGVGHPARPTGPDGVARMDRRESSPVVPRPWPPGEKNLLKRGWGSRNGQKRGALPARGRGRRMFNQTTGWRAVAKFVQIGDTHLGKQLFRVRLIEDQRALLGQVLAIVERERPDALLIAGDVYDVPSPPVYAVSLFDDFLARVVHDLAIPTVIIPGNHDSAERLSFGARAFRRELHIAGPLEGPVEPVTIQDEQGAVAIYPVPFLKPAHVRAVTGDEAVRDQQSAMSRVVADIVAARPPGRSLLMAHTFVTGGAASDSEQEIGAVGGVETVDAATFEPFDYVALGHLHRPQSVGNSRVQYAGSLMKYSLSEVDHPKSVTVVEMNAEGELDVRRVPLAPPRDLRRVSGTLEELLARGPEGPTGDYVVATLEDRGPVLHAMDRLREVYPNAIHLERPQLVLERSIRLPSQDHTQLSVRELFTSFFREVTDGDLDPAETQAMDTMLESLEARVGETP